MEAWFEAPISYFSAMAPKQDEATPSLLPDHHQSTTSQTH